MKIYTRIVGDSVVTHYNYLHRFSVDFFARGLHTCTAVAALTLALVRLSCVMHKDRQY